MKICFSVREAQLKSRISQCIHFYLRKVTQSFPILIVILAVNVIQYHYHQRFFLTDTLVQRLSC